VLADVKEHGLVLDEALHRQDATRELADLRGRVAVREKVLKTYRQVLENAGPDAILIVESQIHDEIVQIETLRGQIAALETQADMARLDVSFRFVERSAPVRDGRSSFAWLNTLNLEDVRTSALEARVLQGPRLEVRAPPEGFSAWDDKRGYRAISADGVVFRIRRVEHEPEGELAFWRDAARERMVAAGYELLGEGLLEGRDDAAWLDLAAPIGDQDWGYLVAFYPRGEDLVIAEAVGEVRALDARKDALLAAMSDLRP
jgi:hypothetical protein